MIQLTLSGANRLAAQLRAMSRNVKRATHKALRAGSQPVLETQRRLIPRDTSTGFRSLGVIELISNIDGTAHIDIGPRPGFTNPIRKLDSDYYLRFPEFGTIHQRPQPFIRPSVSQNRVRSPRIFRRVFLTELRRGTGISRR